MNSEESYEYWQHKAKRLREEMEAFRTHWVVFRPCKRKDGKVCYVIECSHFKEKEKELFWERLNKVNYARTALSCLSIPSIRQRPE